MVLLGIALAVEKDKIQARWLFHFNLSYAHAFLLEYISVERFFL